MTLPSPCANPWNTQLTPGGSSGSGALSVASGMAPLAIGTDLAGSIRIPPAFTGVCSVRATSLLVPAGGHVPAVPDDCSSSIVVSAMAKRVDTLDAFLEVASSSTRSGRTRARPQTRPSHRSGWRRPPRRGASHRPETERASGALARLQEEGASVDLVDGPEIDAKKVGGAYFAFARRYFVEHVSAGGQADPFTGKKKRAPDAEKSAQFVERLRTDIEAWMDAEGVDAWVLPVAPCLPFPHNPKQGKVRLGAEGDESAQSVNY